MEPSNRQLQGPKSKSAAAEDEAGGHTLSYQMRSSQRPITSSQPVTYCSNPDDFVPGHASRLEAQQQLLEILDKQLSSDLDRSKLVEFTAGSGQVQGIAEDAAGLSSLAAFQARQKAHSQQDLGQSSPEANAEPKKGTKRPFAQASIPAVPLSSQATVTEPAAAKPRTLGALSLSSLAGDPRVGSTPLERARGEHEDPRAAATVFAEAAPSVLGFTDVFEAKLQDCKPAEAESESRAERAHGGEEGEAIVAVSKEEIESERLSVEEIRALPGSKFASYDPGKPSETLYLKNLGGNVSERDLVALFLRFQHPAREPLVFRLMQKGRMKGQAFVTFPDKASAAAALDMVNGFLLKGRPVIVQYGRGLAAK